MLQHGFNEKEICYFNPHIAQPSTCPQTWSECFKDGKLFSTRGLVRKGNNLCQSLRLTRVQDFQFVRFLIDTIVFANHILFIINQERVMLFDAVHTIAKTLYMPLSTFWNLIWSLTFNFQKQIVRYSFRGWKWIHWTL